MDGPRASSGCRQAEWGLLSDGALRTAPLLGLAELLRDHGLDAEAEIRAAGCDPALFREPDNLIELVAVGRLLAHTAEVTGRPYPGLDLGRRLGLEVLGALGRAIRFAPDVGTALRAMILHFHLHDRGAVPSLWEGECRAMFGYTIHCPDIPGTDQIYDGALAISLNLLKGLAGARWRPIEVRLLRATPDDVEPFRRHFRARLRFGAEQAAIVFPAADLARPLADANPGAYASALCELDRLAADADLAGKVVRLLRRLFVTGAGPEGVDVEKVARLFCLHERTFKRRLQAEGTTFRALLSQVRYEIARQLLRDTRLGSADIAHALGYADIACFNHAFRRWSGTNATTWRARHRGI